MILAMPRWDPGAEDRLRDAALELFLERGYDNVTVAQITQRAGLTRRTFSRYFTDKRDVLFAGSEQLPAALADAVRHADDALSPFEALLTALVDVGELLAGRVPHAAQRRAVIKASPELQERERTKFAAVTAALAGALRQRGAAESSAELLARAGAAIFQTAFERWTDQPEQASLPARVREAAAELAASLGAVDIPASATRVRP
jgi:AcrR family transcriptional regulator